jgi:diaminohydroxyphosphoribosylaminopyrimidine deaminase/5-amino-6-(5-phosphoribosylamino)uracil reductase
MFSREDEIFMRQALVLAEKGMNTTTPNPRVGCVLVKDGQVIATGWHERAGAAHAERMAIASIDRARVRGATAYITLEPCSHFGRTPPCADLLIEAQIARVVVAMQDPNPQVAGKGLARLRDTGIEVRCGLLEEEARALNIGFVKRMATGLPWVRAKIAASIDGQTALPDGTSQWITDAPARDDGHVWRARACAVMTGIGTVRQDNPRLNVRAIATSRQPLRIVTDARFEIDLGAAILSGGSTLVAVTVDLEKPLFSEKRRQCQDLGVEVIQVPTVSSSHKVDLSSLMRLMGERGCNELHLEAGARLTGAMLQDQLVDECLIYLAPMFLGPGLPMAEGLGPWSTLDAVRRWRWQETRMIGNSLRARLVKD